MAVARCEHRPLRASRRLVTRNASQELHVAEWWKRIGVSNGLGGCAGAESTRAKGTERSASVGSVAEEPGA